MRPIIRASRDIIRVDFSAEPRVASDAASVRHALERAVDGSDERHMLLDYRALGPGADEIREAVQEWARTAHIEAIAAVVDGELARVRLNMTALSLRLPMRGFLTEKEALAWLLDPEQRRPTREVKQRT
jgi:hypothetical protein